MWSIPTRRSNERAVPKEERHASAQSSSPDSGGGPFPGRLWASADALQAVGEAGVGLYFNGAAPPEGPAYDAFVAQYEATYGESPTKTPYHARTYDAAELLLHAIEAVAVQEEDGTLHIGRQALRDALYATAGFQGLTGSLTCDEYGDCGALRLQIARLDDPAAGLEGLKANVIWTYPPDE